MRLEVATFEMGTPKEAAVKVLEEAAEAYARWDVHDKYEPQDWEPRPDAIRETMLAALANELADVVQAACNLAARYGIDMADAMGRCRKRNEDRGRYA